MAGNNHNTDKFDSHLNSELYFVVLINVVFLILYKQCEVAEIFE
jgi:hypothetical protein